MNLDPLAELSYELTPYRYGFNNPLSFIDPDGLYEWRVNAETGEFEKIGDKGGDENQHIYFNDDEDATAVLEGESIYVGAAATDRFSDGEFTFAVSTKDLWSDLPDEYQGAYTTKDLRERYLAQKEGGEKYEMIRSQEKQGLARRDQIWNLRDKKQQLINDYGNASGLALAADTGMLQEIVGNLSAPTFGPNIKRNSKSKFNPQFTPRKTQLSNNPWIKFLQQNKGKYKGRNWLNQARIDYHKLKASGKL